MSIFNKIFSNNQSEQKSPEPDVAKTVSLEDIPRPPKMTQALEERRKRDEMVKKGYDFPMRFELSYIDDNGERVII